MLQSLIGHTPLIALGSTQSVNVLAKAEWLNPTASIKDRVAAYIIEKKRADGSLAPGQPIVEASSGNMGTSLAAIGRAYGHPVHVTCPAKTGQMKRGMIQALGAELTICPDTTDGQSPDFYVNRAMAIAESVGGILINQYDNPLNPACHYDTTGAEIVEQCHKQGIVPDYLVTVGGSGGTISGVGKRLKEDFPDCQVIMPDPVGSVYYDLFYHGKIIPDNVKGYRTEGPGNPVFCQSMDFSVIDQVVQFDDAMAFDGCAQLAKDTGICAGHSSGANYAVVQELLKTLDLNKPATIITMILDSGMKYPHLFE